jgi:hypothetical protein
MKLRPVYTTIIKHHKLQLPNHLNVALENSVYIKCIVEDLSKSDPESY